MYFFSIIRSSLLQTIPTPLQCVWDRGGGGARDVTCDTSEWMNKSVASKHSPFNFINYPFNTPFSNRIIKQGNLQGTNKSLHANPTLLPHPNTEWFTGGAKITSNSRGIMATIDIIPELNVGLTWFQLLRERDKWSRLHLVFRRQFNFWVCEITFPLIG